jgi:hypothetical protein
VQHDRALLEQLSAFSPVSFDGEVFRATPRSLNPLAPSVSGGRWMIPGQTPTLYTSMEADGALAEIAFHWSLLSPIPSKPAMLHRIQLGTKKSIRLARGDLIAMGVDWARYTQLGYERTQAIGAAVAHLECDGLIAPSARWRCENVMIFFTNYVGDDNLATVLRSEEVDWRVWAQNHGVAPHPI